MTKTEKTATKDQIINAARDLFSQYGYDGTSIRQIAEKSETNIAAVNYHFRNKHGLYWSIIDEAHRWLEEGVADLVQKAENSDDLVQSIFHYMSQGKSFVRSTMKALLTDGVPEPDPGHPFLDRHSPQKIGPPGGHHFAQFLQKKYKDQATPEAIQWAVQSIFSSILHWTMMCSTESFKKVIQSPGPINEKTIEDTVIHMSRAVISYMCDKKVWGSP